MSKKLNPKKIAKLAIKLAITLGAIAYVFSQIDLTSMAATLVSANLFWLAFAFIAFNASKIASAIRLNHYYRALSVPLGEKENLILYYVGMFYNLFLPGGISGDGYKIYLLNRHFHTGLKPLTQATLLDRISGLSALLFLGALLFCFSSFAPLHAALAPLALAGLIMVLPVTWYLTKYLFNRFLVIFRVTTYYAFVVQLFQLVSAFFIIMALGAEVHTLDYLTLFLISSVVAVLPISVGGVGVRELTFLYGFGLIGADVTTAVSFSLLFFIITALSSLIGAGLKTPFQQ